MSLSISRSKISFDSLLRFEVFLLYKHEVIIQGAYLATEEDVELCCDRLFRSELFIKNSDGVRYGLISIANEVYLVSRNGIESRHLLK